MQAMQNPASTSPPSALDWARILPSNLEAPAELMPVASNCSTSHNTWLQANPIVYNVRLRATRDQHEAGRHQYDKHSCWDL